METYISLPKFTMNTKQLFIHKQLQKFKMAAINKKLSYFASCIDILKYLLVIDDNIGVVYIFLVITRILINCNIVACVSFKLAELCTG